MKLTIIAVLMSVFVNTAFADEQSDMPTPVSTASHAITPFELSFLAYQGEFKPQGISGFGGLCSELRWGQVTAKSVARAAVDTKFLEASYLTDSGFLSNLDFQLRSVCQ